MVRRYTHRLWLDVAAEKFLMGCCGVPVAKTVADNPIHFGFSLSFFYSRCFTLALFLTFNETPRAIWSSLRRKDK